MQILYAPLEGCRHPLMLTPLSTIGTIATLGILRKIASP